MIIDWHLFILWAEFEALMRRKKQYKGYWESVHIWVEPWLGVMRRERFSSTDTDWISGHQSWGGCDDFRNALLLRKISRITIQKSLIDCASNSNQIHINVTLELFLKPPPYVKKYFYKEVSDSIRNNFAKTNFSSWKYKIPKVETKLLV